MINKGRAAARPASAGRRSLLDVVLVAAAFVTGALKLQPWNPRPDWEFLAAVVLTVSAVSMIWRRRLPGVVFAGAAAGNTLQLFLEPPETVSINAGLVIAAYAVAAHSRGPARVVLPAAAVVPMATAAVYNLGGGSGQYAVPAGTAIAAAVIGFPWLLGANAEARHRAMTALADRAARLEAERELRAVRAVLEERGRIARELHDIVAHHVSVMGVQAGAARLAMTADPVRAEASLRSVESTARTAVGEMRRMLGVLRESNGTPAGDPVHEPGVVSPQPGLADLPRLAGGFADAGLPIEMTVDWQLATGVVEPPEAVQLSAYRIVEQALTNVLEHAGAAATAVRVVVTAQAVEITVTNAAGTGRVAAGSGAGRGHGTVGMRERVKMFDGVLNAGALPDGGYRVHARLPLGAAR